MTHYVNMTSGGEGSYGAALAILGRYAKPGDRLTLLFADVGGNNPSPHAGEDEDTYRFLVESSRDIIRQAKASGIDATLVTVMDGRDIWQVFRDNRFLGNSRIANCSKYLKRIPCREWLDANCDPDDTVVVVGIDWTEAERLGTIVRNYLPYKAIAPLCDFGARSKSEIRDVAISHGVEPQRLYRAGMPHANCGGGCVRAGQAQFALLLREYPERYAYWEENEQGLRDFLEANVAILKDRTKGKSVPLTLRSFREGIEAQTLLFDPNDFGGCGCFTEAS